jgi:methyl-accepting chemotaxis protein
MDAFALPHRRAGLLRRMAARLWPAGLPARTARLPVSAAAPAALARIDAAGGALDDAFAGSLQAAVRQTEESTLGVMERMRGLSDRTAELMASVDAAIADADGQERQVAADVALLARVADFLHRLPERVENDMRTLARIGTEIESLSTLAASVQAISMQSHLLSINAAIEASRAGQAGAAFKVVAEEMRMLAGNSHAAASHIGGVLGRARAVLCDGMEVNTAASAREAGEIAAVADNVRHLQARLDGISACYRDRFAEVTAHGAALAEGTADVLGAMQFQDVLRQHVERMEHASRERSALVARLAATVAAGPAADALADDLEELLCRFSAEEARHGQDGGAHGGGAALIELF